MEHTPQAPTPVSQDAMNPARNSPEPLDILILAAGLGTRMRSSVAKVLHKLDGRPLIAHVCGTAAALTPRRVYVVVGHQAAAVEQAVRAVLGERAAVTFITQAEQRGTGDAVMAARETVAGEATTDGASTLLVLSGDVPLMRADTLAALVHQHRTHRGRGAACTLMSVRLDDPMGYGRIVRDEENRFNASSNKRTRRRMSARSTKSTRAFTASMSPNSSPRSNVSCRSTRKASIT
jgi:bifunctional UDP-N-acetylglucosamine pyrophosphorylase/glucosamine-1-phosphate N-acetyltransferase